jgi:uncharacterized RDD family membrane protein YckC
MNEAASLQPSMTLSNSPLHEPTPVRAGPPGARSVYLALLTWAFTLFNTLRAVAYLPTMWAIHTSGDSSQHSLWTWCTWLGANVTMAAWLYEQNGQRLGRAVIVNLGNATMCAVTVVLIAAHRSGPF